MSNAQSDTKTDTNAPVSEQNAFGNWLRKQRRMLDLSQRELAHLAGCAEITLRRIEAGALKPSKELAAILLEKVGIPPAASAQWVPFARGQSGIPSQPISVSEFQPHTNLPALISSFIGRKKEQSDISQLIEKHRLVTLVGSGGVGKTRLAIKVAGQLLENFVDGVWLVELAPIASQDSIPQVTAAVLGIIPTANTPILDRLIHFLHSKSTLLILDNCEHLLDDCARVAEYLLKYCPNLKILTTSREALGILGEASYRVPSMVLPNIQQLIDRLQDVESVRLFEQRAQLVQTDFRLTMENALAVAQICNRLDGIPLAIELAAVQVNLLSPAGIAEQLDQTFDVLAGGSRTALPRQQTMRASIEWSWNLLTDTERLLLRRLSVFSGGWILESAQVACSDDRLVDLQVKELMRQLVKKSLVVQGLAEPGHTRFSLHEAIRQFAFEKLGEAGEIEHIQAQHLQYLLNFSERAQLGMIGPGQFEWHDRILSELDNLWAGLNYAVKTSKVEAGLNLICNLGSRFWEEYSSCEGLGWLEQFLRIPQVQISAEVRARALLMRGLLLYVQQEFEQARRSTEAALADYRLQGNQPGEFDALMLLGTVLWFTEGMDQKVVIQQEALALAKSIGDARREARALIALGWDRRDKQESRQNWREAIRGFRRLEDWQSLAISLGTLGEWLAMDGEKNAAQKMLDEAQEINLHMKSRLVSEFVLTGYGYLAILDEDYDLAGAFFQENVKTMDESGSRMSYLWACTRWGVVNLLQGNIDEARLILTQALREFYKDGNMEGVAFAMSKMASLFAAERNFEQAARVIGWINSRHEINLPLIDQAAVDRAIAMIQTKIGATSYAEAFRKGNSMALEDAVRLALNGEGNL
jgi:predicted ATPase/DNA-binding XRE family transcriptional regulator